MKYVSLLVLLLGISIQSAYAAKVTVKAKELERIYQLQESKYGLSFPALFIYDTQNQRYLTKQQVIAYIKIATDIKLDDEQLAVVKYIVKPVYKHNISIKHIKQVANSIDFNKPYVAFYYNLQDSMITALELEELKPGNDQLNKILAAANNLEVYSFSSI